MKSSLMILNTKKEAIETVMNTSDHQIFRNRDLNELLLNIVEMFFDDDEKVQIEHLKSFLLKESYLQQVAFQTPRTEVLYLWREIGPYKVLPYIRPTGYYTHLSALYFHGLLDYEPNSVYFNMSNLPALSQQPILNRVE